MKWVLVVLIGGVTPVTTDVTFEKLSDCFAAEQQLRQTYAEAFYAWNSREEEPMDRHDRRRGRNYFRAREMDTRKFANTGTCVPHAGTDQPITSLNRSEQPAATTPPPTPTPSPTAH